MLTLRDPTRRLVWSKLTFLEAEFRSRRSYTCRHLANLSITHVLMELVSRTKVLLHQLMHIKLKWFQFQAPEAKYCCVQDLNQKHY